LMFLAIEGSYRIARRDPVSEATVNPATEALLAHTEELRLQRETREREDSPIAKIMREALDPDLRRNRSAPKQSEPVTPRRAPLKQIVARSGELGWDVTGKTNIEIMTLLSGFRQAALDGDVRMWGRQDRNSAESLKRKEPLVEIERSHWKDFEIDVRSVLSSAENLETRSYNIRAQRDAGFIDLHLDALAAELWLLGAGQKYKDTHKG